jgi:hypothetical protein
MPNAVNSAAAVGTTADSAGRVHSSCEAEGHHRGGAMHAVLHVRGSLPRNLQRVRRLHGALR